jgi:plasmid stabilization system protein ParE
VGARKRALKKEVVISQSAEDDLARIYSYLRVHYDLDAAERFRFRAEKALAQLGQHPEIGPHPGWATRHQRLRFWIISKTNYIIYYESLEERVSIERILDGRRDVHRIIELGYEDKPEETDQS